MVIRISVVAQHRLIGAALAALIRTIRNFRVVGTILKIDDIPESVSSKPPDIVLIDCDLLKQTEKLLQRLACGYPSVPLIALASEYTDTALLGMLGSGAASVVLKDAPSCRTVSRNQDGRQRRYIP